MPFARACSNGAHLAFGQRAGAGARHDHAASPVPDRGGDEIAWCILVGEQHIHARQHVDAREVELAARAMAASDVARETDAILADPPDRLRGSRAERVRAGGRDLLDVARLEHQRR